MDTAEFAEAFPAAFASWVRGDETRRGPGRGDRPPTSCERMVPALRECLASLDAGETGIVVTHGASLKVALLGLLGWPPRAGSHAARAWTTARWAVAGRALRRRRPAAAARRLQPAGRPRARFRIRGGRWLRFPSCPDNGRRGCGAAGSAPPWHGGGQGFESPQLHRSTGRFPCGDRPSAVSLPSVAGTRRRRRSVGPAAPSPAQSSELRLRSAAARRCDRAAGPAARVRARRTCARRAPRSGSRRSG